MGLNFRGIPHQHRRQSSGDPATHPVSCIHLKNCFVDVYSDRAFGSELCSLLERDAATLLVLFFWRASRIATRPVAKECSRGSPPVSGGRIFVDG